MFFNTLKTRTTDAAKEVKNLEHAALSLEKCSQVTPNSSIGFLQEHYPQVSRYKPAFCSHFLHVLPTSLYGLPSMKGQHMACDHVKIL